MTLTQLEIRNLRSLVTVSLKPTNGVNLIIGPNASGKTSLLESIHLLSTGRSFRNSTFEQLISLNRNSLLVSGHCHADTGAEFQLSVEHDRQYRRMNINGQPCQRVAELAQILPLQVISPDTHYDFIASAKHRRGLLDWGLFHVEPAFYTLWVGYYRVLRQRNAALKLHNDTPAARIWDKELVIYANKVHKLRRQYLAQWNRCLKTYSQALLQSDMVELRLHPGWPMETGLEKTLVSNHYRDYARGYTHSGIHRADLEIFFQGQPIRHHASHGQQKLIVIALRLAQLALFSRHTGRHCVLLLDDLAAELDTRHRSRLMNLLSGCAVQAFVTATDASAIETEGWSNSHVFHVERGSLCAA